MAILVQNKVIIPERKLKDQLIQRAFGEQKEQKLVLDLWEAAYLAKKEKIGITDEHGKALSEEDIIREAQKKDRKFYQKYVVYSDMRERGFVVKTGFKFGSDFRVYPRGKKPGEEHTYWTLNVMDQNEKISMIGFSRMSRLSGNLKTKLLVAVIDSEDDINYYQIERITP
jgi:tRNA-intron endonuclease